MTTFERAELVQTYKRFANELLTNPDNAEALVDQMALLADNGDRAHARHYVYLARRAWQLAPDSVAVMLNYASALHRAGDYHAALKMYAQAVARNDPQWHARALFCLGVCHRCLGDYKKAIEYYQRAHALEPEHIEYEKDIAMAMLADERWLEGLQAYEVRKQVAYEQSKWTDKSTHMRTRLPPGVVQWEGQDLTGKRVVVYNEEGLGDFIHHSRFIPALRKLGVASIAITGVTREVLELVAANMQIDDIVPLSGPFECDYVIGSASVPWRCGIDLDQIDGKPYFSAAPADFPLRGTLNVGLVWRGNPKHARDYERSIALSEYCTLFELPGVAFYSLQLGDAAREITHLGLDGFIADLTPMIGNWLDTARLLKRLDALVSVDTAIVHLAGALGVPALMITGYNCDWRWKRGSTKTRWYDSVRVLRQADPNNWNEPIEIAKEYLEIWHGRKSAERADGARESRLDAAE